jgi:CelD/BcsL family acetyltransferase involved in cellulose biosynthesis
VKTIRAAKTTSTTIHLLETYSEYLALRTEWDELFATLEHPTPFLSWDWIDIWLKHFSFSSNVRIYIARKKDVLVGIAPLYAENRSLKTAGIKKIHFIGDELLADYMDFLIRPNNEDITQSFMNALSRYGWSVVSLKRIRQDSPNLEEIRKYINERPLRGEIFVNCASPFIKIEGEWPNFFNQREKKKLRQEIRTTCNKLEKKGVISYEKSTCETVQHTIDALIKFHLERQSKKIGDSIFSNTTITNFLKDIADKFTRKGWVRASCLKLDGTIVSAVYSFHMGDTFYYWIPSFSIEYNKYSMGKLHLRYMIQECFESGDRIFDFMIGEERYKTQWSTGKIMNYECRLYSNPVLYLIFLISRHTRDRLKEIKNKNHFLQKIWMKIKS